MYKVPGETNTDDLSPAVDAWSRPDIPLHAQAMLKSRMDKPLETIEEVEGKRSPSRLCRRCGWNGLFTQVSHKLSPLAHGR